MAMLAAHDLARPKLARGCFPPAAASQCICPRAADADKARLPTCYPTTACNFNSSTTVPFAAARSARKSAFVIALDYNASRVRYWYRHDPFESYAASMRLIMRLVLSLQAVETRLPILLLASGTRHTGYEERLTSKGVRIVSQEYGLKASPDLAQQTCFHHARSLPPLPALRRRDGVTRFTWALFRS